MPRLGVSSTPTAPLFASRTAPKTSADGLPENYRLDSTFARIFDCRMDPKKGTKGRRIDGGESDDGIKSAFFQAPPRWRRTHFERRVQSAEESERRGFRRPGSICAKLTIIRAVIARMPRMGKSITAGADLGPRATL